jgi:RHS repeat-associated protein
MNQQIASLQIMQRRQAVLLCYLQIMRRYFINFTFTYDANNRRTTRTLPNGTTSTYSYDQASRITGIQTANNAATIDNVAYTYDNAGNRITKTQPQTNYNYTYDAIYRLTQATPSSGTQENYTYDQVGNRLTKAPDTSPNTNETTQYSYDDENRLTGVQITQNGNIKQLTFAYDPFGKRISKTIVQDGIGTDCQSPNVCPRTINYVYDGQNIIMEYDQTGNITAKYTHGPNTDEPLAVQQGTNTYYYHADGLGSITALSNSSGNIVQTYSYDSFGNMTATGNIRQPFTYTAREYDYATGMYFYRARYYDPKVGRFVTKDPILNPNYDNLKKYGANNFERQNGVPSFYDLLKAPQNFNPYVYVLNNPINFIDPNGLSAKGSLCRAACWAAGGAICAAVACGCAAGTTITVGGLAIPCTAVIIASCSASAGGASICSDICPP